MKNLSLLFVALNLLQLNLLAQVGWISQNSGVSDHLQDVYFVSEDLGWAVGIPYSGNPIILNTTNGGDNWAIQYTGTYSYWLHSVFFVNEQLGWAVGGEILHTTNGGNDWTLQNTTVLPDLSSVFFIDAQIGWIVGVGGSIIKTINGGINWETLVDPSSSQHNLESVYFSDTNNGWAAGYHIDNQSNYSWKIINTTDGGDSWHGEGQILTTTNGGSNWTIRNSGISGNPKFSDAHFVNAAKGWAAGYWGVVAYSIDGGVTWSEQSTPTQNWLTSIHFINSDVGWAVGQFGTIIKTITGGLTAVEEINSSLPIGYKLNQNYPNPFNPSTIIKYQIPEMSFATLKVYDVLGNEIATLVNEEKPGGKYEVEFISHSGSIWNLSSGIYFYRLQVYPTNDGVSSFVETKKMILLR
jgi:photosystem II stability/assembly factor-like uncharacterized protein